jgi:hypothetical protein
MTEPTSTAPAPTNTEPAADDPLRAFLSGKRGSERHPCHVPVLLEGALAPVAGTAFDLSAGGALVEISEPAFLEAEGGGGAQAYLELLTLHTQAGLQVSFPGHATRVTATVVRWTASAEEQAASRVGLRFARALTPAELTALRSGVPTSERETAADWDSDVALPYVPRRGTALQVLVFRALHPEFGPVVAGRALGVGPAGLALRMDGGRALIEVAGLLAGHNLLLVLQERGLVLWETVAHVAWVAPVPDGSAVDVGLIPDQPCPPAGMKRFRKA